MPAIRYPGNRRAWLPAVLALSACSPPPGTAPEGAGAGCHPDGFLITELHGAIRADVDWHADTLTCEGMPRPEGRGARLRFSAPLSDAPDDSTVAIILGIADLEPGSAGRELPTNVTLIEEGAGRFYGTQDTSGCWTDVDPPLRLDDETYQVSGTVYCVSPLAELNGGSSVSFTELGFSGCLDWTIPE